MFAGLRAFSGDRFRRDVEESSALLSGYRDMVASLRVELETVRVALADERVAWNRERREVYEEIDKLRDSQQREQAAWHNERQALHREIEQLREEVATLQSRDKTDRTRRSDRR